MDCIILVRLNNDRVTAISDDENMVVFSHMDEAVECAEGQILCQNFPYQIVELDEL